MNKVIEYLQKRHDHFAAAVEDYRNDAARLGDEASVAAQAAADTEDARRQLEQAIAILREAHPTEAASGGIVDVHVQVLGDKLDAKAFAEELERLARRGGTFRP